MGTGSVIVKREGSVVEMRLSNLVKFNAMSLDMWLALGREVRALHQDKSVRALLIRGDGEKAFVSGADISEFDQLRSAENGHGVFDSAVEDAQKALIDCPFPVVACIHGVCMGGGLGLIMACDLRYASMNTRFRMPAARIGLGYSFAGVQRMVAVLGPARVADLFMTARPFDAIEAERIDLVHAILPDEKLDAFVAETLRKIAENAPLTVSYAKAAIHLSLSLASISEDAFNKIEHARLTCLQSEDYIEGRRAFAEKRDPDFSGR